MSDPDGRAVLRHVPDWSIIVLPDSPARRAVVTNNRPRGRVLVKPTYSAGELLPADQLVTVVAYPAELAHAAVEPWRPARLGPVPTHVYAMLADSERDRTWTGNPAMRAIAAGLVAHDVRVRGLLDVDQTLVVSHRSGSYELSDNGGELSVIHDGRDLDAVPLTRWRCALRVDTVVYRILCVLDGQQIDYDHDPAPRETPAP